MNIIVVTTDQDKKVRALGHEIADCVRAQCVSPESFDENAVYDLVVIGFSCRGKAKKKADAFVQKLDRAHVHNVALFSAFCFSNKLMAHVIDTCKACDLPLMREQYICKIKPFAKCLPAGVVDTARSYITDMVTVCRDYY